MLYDVSGWVDWNMALDPDGNPNWVNNRADSPIIVNSTAGEFYKQPMYYALAHFSKFIPPDSVRIDTEVLSPDYDIHSVAFIRPDGAIALIVCNA